MTSTSSLRIRLRHLAARWATPPDALTKWVSIAKAGVEIVALIVAGWWAYSRFFVAEAPSLEERGAYASTLEWIPIDKERCTAVFGITVKNIGKRSFDIKKISLSVKLLPTPTRASGIVRLQPTELTNPTLAMKEEFTEGSLVLHYPPEMSIHDDYVFSVPRDAKGASRIALFTFQALAVTENGKALHTPLDEYRWTANCEQSVAALPKPAESPLPDQH